MNRLFFILATALPFLLSGVNLHAGWTYDQWGRAWYVPTVPNAGWGRPSWSGTGVRLMTPSGYSYYPYAANASAQPVYVMPSAPVYAPAPQTLNPPSSSYYYYPRAGQQFAAPFAPGMPRVAPPALRAKSEEQISAQEKRANRLAKDLEQVTRQRDQAQAELAMWTSLGISLDQLRTFQEQLAKLKTENSALIHRNSQLEYKLSCYVGPEKEIKMPGNLSGTVVAVDPKYSFVVLNIGEKQGVAENGKLLVNRHGQLVGKLRVTTVDSNSSIANVLPDWKVAEVKEGDEVIHQ